MPTSRSAGPTSPASPGDPSMVSQAPGRLQVWLLATRPRTLPAAVAPVLVGGAVALKLGQAAWAPFLAAMLGAALLQIGSNLANDYFDFVAGVDTAERLGPVRVTQAGLASPRAVAIATAMAFLLATLVGGYLVTVGGWPIVAIGLASILAGIAYTGGPFPLGYKGLGEIFVFLFFGLIAVTGTTYVQTHGWSWLALELAIPVGLLSAAILVVNNLRDLPTDARTGKGTLAVRFGERFTLFEYGLLLVGAYLVPVELVVVGELGPGALLPLLTLPLAVRLYRSVRVERGRALNRRLADTAQLLFVFSALLALGTVLRWPWS